MTWQRIGMITGSIVGIVTVGGYALPYVRSDPAPLAGTERVERLDGKIAATLLDVQRVQQKIIQHQNDSDAALLDLRLSLNEMRQRAVTRDVEQIGADMVHHPLDQTLKDALDHDKQDLEDIALEHRLLLTEKYHSKH